MIRLSSSPVSIRDGVPVSDIGGATRDKTLAYGIMRSHDASDGGDKLNIRFDAMVSHDITYVGIIQTARASGMKTFPLPYAMTNCHNSLCAVGGTINEDDHVFGLSAAIKYGGVFVPANLAVIHQYARETLVKCGGMILGSDSHTRYGALGCMGIGEGGPELAKQLLNNTYDVSAPEVVLVWVEGAPRHGVGPHDIAIELVASVFKSGFVKNKILEFAGPGISNLSVDFRNGIDVMTTETTCLSSIWETDDAVAEYYNAHGRKSEFAKLSVRDGALYDSVIYLNLSESEPMIALPFHPSNAYTLRDFLASPSDILRSVECESAKLFGNGVSPKLTDKVKSGKVYVDQGVIAGCAGGLYENLSLAASVMGNSGASNGYFGLSVYPASQPVGLALAKSGVFASLMEAGAVIKPAFCGPCFGAGDVPCNNGFSIRHTTRNFPNREGSKPSDGQASFVALMDARSIAATAANGGVLTSAADTDYSDEIKTYEFDSSVYEKRVYRGFGDAHTDTELRLGPNITDWPAMYPLSRNILLELDAVIRDPVTTTDELIPSGETSSYRSNPVKLATFTLSRRVPEYVALAKACADEELSRRNKGECKKLRSILSQVGDADALISDTAFASCVFANKPGDGSAREQAASCQRVLGGGANIAFEYATKRYRSNCINWGIIPFTLPSDTSFDCEQGDCIFVPDIRDAIINKATDIPAKIVSKSGVRDITLVLTNLTDTEREILLRGCLMNYYASKM